MSSVQVGSLTSHSNGFNGAGGPISLSPAKPTGVQAGDILIACGYTFENSFNTAIPSGWTAVVSTSVGSPRANFQGWAVYMWMKVATGSEPANYGFTFSEGNTTLNVGYGAFVSITAWRGVTSGTPFEVNTVTTANSDLSTISATIQRNGPGRVFLVASMGQFNQDHALADPNPTMTVLDHHAFNSGVGSSPGTDIVLATVESGAGPLTETCNVGTPQLNDGRMLMLAQFNDPVFIASD